MRAVAFTDRRDAGRRLAAHLRDTLVVPPDALVLAVPRGGVPVAAELARALGAPLDVLVVRKIGAPGQPEYAIGAIGEGGVAVIDRTTVRLLGVTQAELDATVHQELREVERRVARYRGPRSTLVLAGRTVILVDDGMATGLTDLAALRAARAAGAARIMVAVPVASTDAVDLLAREADDVRCRVETNELGAVGAWYRDFSPVGDDEVLALLGRAGRATA